MKKKKIIKISKDPKFNDILVNKFINHLMNNGKKDLAYRIFYNAMNKLKENKYLKEKINIINVFKKALSRIMPHIEVRSKRIGGSTFQIPIPIRSERKINIAMKWLIYYARKRNEKSMSSKLSAEILSALKEEGSAVKRRIDTHKMAESNKAFSHFKF
jgi:small subunit ribosomal protein S7